MGEEKGWFARLHGWLVGWLGFMAYALYRVIEKKLGFVLSLVIISIG